MFCVPAELLQAIGNYLVTRPYQEVAGLIKGLEKDAKEMEDDAVKIHSVSASGN